MSDRTYTNPRNHAERLEYVEPETVHLAVPNETTGMCGSWVTDTDDLRTACGRVWRHPSRPRRAGDLEYVTCAECAARRMPR